jgi:hypothetical protein
MRMTAGALDLVAARLEELGDEQERLRAELWQQVEEFGFTPPRAVKSKRLLGIFYQFTLTVGLTTEVKDAEVEKIAADPLSRSAPRNLRMMFYRAVETKETAPRLRIEKNGRRMHYIKPTAARKGGRGELAERSRADLPAFQALLIAERCGLV